MLCGDRGDMCICIADSPCWSAKTQHCKAMKLRLRKKISITFRNTVPEQCGTKKTGPLLCVLSAVLCHEGFQEHLCGCPTPCNPTASIRLPNSFPLVSGMCTQVTQLILRRTDWGREPGSPWMHGQCHLGSKFHGPSFLGCDLKERGPVWKSDQCGPRAETPTGWA